MPDVTNFRDVADLVISDMRDGRATRATIGSKTEAWTWLERMPVSLASFVPAAKAEAMSTPVVKVKPSGTPVAKVARGGLKPTAVEVVSDTITLSKYAGLATFDLEDLADTKGLAAAIRQTMAAGSLLAWEADAVAELAANKGDTATGADWAVALVAGQAAILGAGGAPGLAVVSALDYGSVVASVIKSAGFAHNPASPIGEYLGSLLHISAKLPAGKGYVCDPQSLLALEHVDSPLVIVDTLSQAEVNKGRIVTDLLAGFHVASDAYVVEVSVA